MSVSINVTDTVSPMLKRLMTACEDYSKPLQLAGLYLQKSLSKQFEADGKPRWKPLSDATIRQRRKHSSKPLQDTARLKRSYIGRGFGNLWSLTKFKLEFGSNLRYAAIHQYGGDITRTSGPGSARLRVSKKHPNGYRFAKGSFKGKTRTVNWMGGKSYTIHIPARPLSIQPEDTQVINKIFEKYIIESAK